MVDEFFRCFEIASDFNHARLGIGVCAIHKIKVIPSDGISNTFFSLQIRYKGDLWMN
jgi:hypothetical protein